MKPMAHNHKPPRRGTVFLLAAAAASTPLASRAANDYDYNGASGTRWSNPSDWILVNAGTQGIPTAGDEATIAELSIVSPFSVTYDFNYTSLTALSQLYLAGSSSAAVVLNQQSSGENLFAADEIVGNSGLAGIQQTAATNSVTDALYLGVNPGGSGFYSLSVFGSLVASNATEYIGYAGGTGTFTQLGTNTAYSLELGEQSGSGRYSLEAGILTAGEFIGDSGAGTFIQTGGTNIASGGLFLGYASGSSGSYSLSSGPLAVSNGDIIGNFGAGTFIQSGGSHGVSGNLDLGEYSGGSGTYTLSGGTATVSGNTSIGGSDTAAGGTGIVSISGGTMRVAGTLKIWNTNGSYLSLAGGTLSVGALELTDSNPYLFNLWSAGTLSFSAPTVIDSNFALGPSITLASGRTLAASAALTNNGQIALAGGALGGSGTLVNGTGQIRGYGTIGGSGGFTNSGDITQSGGPLVLSNSGINANTGNIDLAAGNQLQLTGGNLANTGTLNLNGAAITGTALLTNTAGGIIWGRGAITTPLANGGTIGLSDGTLTTPAFTNNGIVAVNGVTANLSGGTIANASTIQGNGGINNNIVNTGTIEPTDGTLALNGTIANNAAGLITATQGSKLLLAQGLGTNAGLISLTGGTIDTNNTALTNAGTISGYGVLRTGSLLNNAASEIELTGGTATVDGPVSNSGRIDVKYATAVFNGPVTNNAGATIKATGGSVAFVGTFTNNGTYASDPSTNYFQNLIVGPGGTLTGSLGDQFHVSGDFTNNSTQAAAWNTSGALLQFEGGTSHAMSVAGTVGQFGWGTIGINAGDSLNVGANSATASATTNAGTLRQTAGDVNLGALTGEGAVAIGNSAGGAAASMIVSSFGQSAVTINATGSLAVSHGTSPVLNTTSNLTIATGGKLDLSNSSLHLSYVAGASPLSTIRSELFTGYDGGKWDGSGIVTSVGDANHSIGYVDTGNTPRAGQPADTLELQLAIPGDTTLKGSVNLSDLLTLARNFGKTNADWAMGDFDYDGKVDLNDFLLLARHFGGGLSPAMLGALDPANRAEVQGMLNQVPEPGTLPLLGMAAGMLLPRKRRTVRRRIEAANA